MAIRYIFAPGLSVHPGVQAYPQGPRSPTGPPPVGDPIIRVELGHVAVKRIELSTS
jgi:hypothetical protein